MKFRVSCGLYAGFRDRRRVVRSEKDQAVRTRNIQEEPDQSTVVGISKKTAASESFQYQPLDRSVQSAFRLLTLLPGPKGSEPRCTLSVNTWGGGHCSYEALSYVWGDSEARKSIKSQRTSSLHSATSNSKTALDFCGSMPFALTSAVSRREITKSRRWGRYIGTAKMS